MTSSLCNVIAKRHWLTNNLGTCGLSVTTFFHQVLNYYYLTVYIMFKPKIRVRVRVRVKLNLKKVVTDNP